MAFLSNQWLKNSPERKRGNRPAKVAVTVQRVVDGTVQDLSGTWTDENGASVAIHLSASKKHEVLNLTPGDVHDLLKELLPHEHEVNLPPLAIMILEQLDANQLLYVLAEAFSKRKTW